MLYSICVNPKVEKKLLHIDRYAAIRMKNKIKSLAHNPRPNGSVKLSGEENAYRVRVGDYRIIYEIYDSKLIIMVINIGHRKDVYEK